MGQSVRRGFQLRRLAAAIEQCGMSRPDLARLAEISPVSIGGWLEGARAPDIERLARVAAVLKVPVSEFVQVPVDERMPSDLRFMAGMTQVVLARRAGLSTNALCRFERAEAQWNRKRAELIATALGVGLEELEAAWWRARRRPAGTPP